MKKSAVLSFAAVIAVWSLWAGPFALGRYQPPHAVTADAAGGARAALLDAEGSGASGTIRARTDVQVNAAPQSAQVAYALPFRDFGPRQNGVPLAQSGAPTYLGSRGDRFQPSLRSERPFTPPQGEPARFAATDLPEPEYWSRAARRQDSPAPQRAVYVEPAPYGGDSRAQPAPGWTSQRPHPGPTTLAEALEGRPMAYDREGSNSADGGSPETGGIQSRSFTF